MAETKPERHVCVTSDTRQSLAAVSDEQLVARILARGLGWRLAMDVFVQRHRGWMFQRCLWRLGNHADAQDVAQDALMRALRGLPGFAGRAKVRTWLGAIVDNQCYTYGVRRARQVNVAHIEALIELIDGRAHGGPVSTAQDDVLDVARVMVRISPQAQEVLRLRFYQDHSLEEIADLLGINLSAAKMRLYRALAHFRIHYLAEDSSGIVIA